MQKRRNSIANKLELCLFRIKPSIWDPEFNANFVKYILELIKQITQGKDS